MIMKYGLPMIAVSGIMFAMFVLMQSNQVVPAAAPVADPSRSPFHSFVAGAGIIEPASESIAIGTEVAGVVREVCVKVNDTVRKGDPLFKLDDRKLQAEMLVRQGALKVAQQQLERLRQLPRQEDLLTLRAKIKEGNVNLADLKSQLELWEAAAAADKRAVSEEDLTKRRNAVKNAEAAINTAQAQLEQASAGTWKYDLDVAQAQMDSLQAQIEATRTDIERLTVRAPIDGKVLQLRIRVGEFAPAGVLNTPLMIMGQVDMLFVRVDVDENDAWRIEAGAPAHAYARGNREIGTPLRFVRVEPFVVPKKSLTGDSTERVDTRVLQLLYQFDPGDKALYVGQQMDVFIKAPGVEDKSHSKPAPALGR